MPYLQSYLVSEIVNCNWETKRNHKQLQNKSDSIFKILCGMHINVNFLGGIYSANILSTLCHILNIFSHIFVLSTINRISNEDSSQMP